MQLTFLESNRCPLLFHLLLSIFALSVDFVTLTILEVEMLCFEIQPAVGF